MKVIQENAAEFKIYGEDLKVIDLLPPGIYTIHSSMMGGPYLRKEPDITDNDIKIYGSHNKKIDKVIKAFAAMKSKTRMGTILSGQKGLGKSLMANGIAKRCVEELKMPVILVTGYIDYLEDFTNRIQQPVMLLFDEFEKRFTEAQQNSLLTFFDGGTNTYERLFVITCNSYRELTQYYINRPGRFHYHFQFESPDMNDIKEYLEDNLLPAKIKEKNEILSFAMATKLNFDCLAAIVSEINNGYEFKESIKDLNIMKADLPSYDVEILFKSGVKLTNCIALDTFTEKCNFNAGLSYEEKKKVNDYIKNDYVEFEFLTKDLIIDYQNDKILLSPSNLIMLRDQSLIDASCDTEEQVKFFDDAYDEIVKFNISRRVNVVAGSFY